MARLYILCEGPTEEIFVKRNIISHLSKYNIV